MTYFGLQVVLVFSSDNFRVFFEWTIRVLVKFSSRNL